MVPLKGTFLLTATSELRGGKYLQVWGQIIHWYNLALETHNFQQWKSCPFLPLVLVNLLLPRGDSDKRKIHSPDC